MSLCKSYRNRNQFFGSEIEQVSFCIFSCELWCAGNRYVCINEYLRLHQIDSSNSHNISLSEPSESCWHTNAWIDKKSRLTVAKVSLPSASRYWCFHFLSNHRACALVNSDPLFVLCQIIQLKRRISDQEWKSTPDGTWFSKLRNHQERAGSLAEFWKMCHALEIAIAT